MLKFSALKPLLKDLTPPLLHKAWVNLKQRDGFFGNYPDWETAMKEATGYEAAIILEKVRAATLQVKEGKAAYVRDGVVFDRIDYSWPILAALLQSAMTHQNQLSILDFGGALGSHYYQYRSWLSHLIKLHWSVVEQDAFVQCGQAEFADAQLRFYRTIEDCLQDEDPKIILLSSVVQHLPDPYPFLTKLVNYGFGTILLDRTAFVLQGNDRLTVQRVPKWIYPASYPCWFFNQQRFLAYFQSNYELVAEFASLDRANIPSVFKGFIFHQKPGA